VHISRYRLKLPGLEADCPLPSSVEIKKEWSYNSSPSIHLRGVSIDNVTFCTCNMYWSGLEIIMKWSLLRHSGRAWTRVIWAFVNTVMNMQVHDVTGIYSRFQKLFRCSRRTVHHTVS
jgi:hypothetical protein